MQKYILHDGHIVYNMTDTEKEIREIYKESKIFRRILNQEPLQMALAEISDEDFQKYITSTLYVNE